MPINSKLKKEGNIKDKSKKKSMTKSLQTINAGEGVEKREPSYTIGGNVPINWYNNYGEQYGSSLKN